MSIRRRKLRQEEAQRQQQMESRAVEEVALKEKHALKVKEEKEKLDRELEEKEKREKAEIVVELPVVVSYPTGAAIESEAVPFVEPAVEEVEKPKKTVRKLKNV